MNEFPWITVLTLVPLAGGAVLASLNWKHKKLARGFALTCSLAALAIALGMAKAFDPANGGLQFQERYDWVPTVGIQYFVAVDGLGLLLVLLSAVVVPLSILTSWRIDERAPLYFSLVLFLEAGLFGAFTALSFFHWFIFWEISLIPAFFLIRLWGGMDRSAAAMQFFVYTMVGSVAMLVAFMGLYWAARTFDFLELADLARRGQLAENLGNLNWMGLSANQAGLLLFGGIFLGFAVKVPLIPFHTWLPSAYSEAPTGTTILLTGAMSKMGVYGFLRILLPIFPEQMRAVLTPLLWLAIGTIVLSAFAAIAQKDLKRILAYSSVNHLGYCLLGIFAAATATPEPGLWGVEKASALNGVILQMFNHGLTAAALFCFVEFIERRTGGIRGLDDFGGLRKVAPVFCGLMGIATFASLGLPGLNGFVGEFLIFKGTFALTAWAAALSTLGLLATAIVLLTVLQRVFHGPLNERWTSFRDLTLRERWIVAPALGLMFILGVYPQLIVGKINSTVVALVSRLPN